MLRQEQDCLVWVLLFCKVLIEIVKGECGHSSNSYVASLTASGHYYRVAALGSTENAVRVMTYYDASDYCECEYGTKLASITSSSEHDDIWDNSIWYDLYGPMWIGLNDIVQEDTFIWDDGTPYGYDNFANGQPNDWRGQDCTLMAYNLGQWGDADCGNTYSAFVCNAYPTCGNGFCYYEESDNGDYTRVGYFSRIGSSSISISKEDAEKFCSSEFDRELASILSESDNNDAFGDGSWFTDHGSMWIGLTDSETEDTFVWDDGEALSFTKWQSGQPNNWNEQDCVIFTNSNGEWQDCSCDGIDDCTPTAFVCNKIDCDSYSDSYAFVSELSDYGNYYRIASLDSSTGSVVDAMSYYDASDYCFCHYGTRLASISSSAEQDEIFDATWKSTYGPMYIGLNDIETEGVYVWEDGSTYDYTNYASGQPNDWNDQDCMLISSDLGQWGDGSCSTKKSSFVCNAPANEYKPSHLNVVDNLFCGDMMDNWAVVSGNNWKFDRNNCNIKTTNAVSTSDIVWIGLHDGTTSTSEYDSYSGYMLQTSLMIESGVGSARIYFRAVEVASYRGTSYYVALKPATGEIFTGYNYYDTRVELGSRSDLNIQYSQIYFIKIEVDDYFYSVYLNGEIVFKDMSAPSVYSNVFNSGSIGLLTYHTVTTFYKMNIIEWTSLTNDVECYNSESDWSDDCMGCYVTATCNSGYTMTDCSGYGFWKKHGGAQIRDNVCYAYTQSNQKSVKASIRCCRGMSLSGVYDIESRNDWDPDEFTHLSTPDRVIATCGNLNKNSELIGCGRLALAGENTYLHYAGDYDGTRRFESDLGSTYGSCVVDRYDHDSVWFNSLDAIKAYARCIVPNEDKKLKCYSKWSSKSGTSDDSEAIATCPSGYFLSGCMADGADPGTAGRVDGAYFDDDTCVAINGDNGDGVYAVAICCHYYDAPRLSISRDEDSSICKNYFSIGSESIMNDRSGMLDFCCNKLDLIDLNSDSDSGSDSDSTSRTLGFYETSFLDCINSFIGDLTGDYDLDYDVNEFINMSGLYNLDNNYFGGGSVSGSENEKCNVGSPVVDLYTNPSDNFENAIVGLEFVSGLLSLGAAKKEKLKPYVSIASGLATIAGISLGGDGPNLAKIVSDIYENVFSVVSDMFETSWNCTIRLVDNEIASVKAQIYNDLLLSEISGKIQTVGRAYDQLSGKSDSEIFHEFTVDLTPISAMKEVYLLIPTSISDTRVQRALITLIQQVMNQRIVVWSRYCFLHSNITGYDDPKNLPRAGEWGFHNHEILIDYIGHISGAYSDVLENMQFSSYNDIISEINLIFNSKLFCNWVFFTYLYTDQDWSASGNNFDYCRSDICDCDEFESIRNNLINSSNDNIDWTVDTISESDEFNQLYSRIEIQFSDFVLNKYFSSQYYDLKYANDLISTHKMSELFINTFGEDNLYSDDVSDWRDKLDYNVETQIYHYDLDWQGTHPYLRYLDLLDGEDRTSGRSKETSDAWTATCIGRHERWFECQMSSGAWRDSSNTIEFWHKKTATYSNNFAYPQVQRNLENVILTETLQQNCVESTCQFGWSHGFLGLTEIDNGLEWIGMYNSDIKSLSCPGGDSVSIIGARYMIDFKTKDEQVDDETYMSNIIGIEILCNENNDLTDYYKEYKYFNYDNRKLIMGFDRANIGKYEWSPWFICPKKHKLRMQFGSKQDCRVCFDDNTGKEDNHAVAYDFIVKYYCTPY